MMGATVQATWRLAPLPTRTMLAMLLLLPLPSLLYLAAQRLPPHRFLGQDGLHDAIGVLRAEPVLMDKTAGQLRRHIAFVDRQLLLLRGTHAHFYLK